MAYPVSGEKGRPMTLHYVYVPFCCEENLETWAKLVAYFLLLILYHCVVCGVLVLLLVVNFTPALPHFLLH